MVHNYAIKDVKSSNYLKLQSMHPWWPFKLATLMYISSGSLGDSLQLHFMYIAKSIALSLDSVHQGLLFMKGGNLIPSESRWSGISNGDGGGSSTESIPLYHMGQIIWSMTHG